MPTDYRDPPRFSPLSITLAAAIGLTICVAVGFLVASLLDFSNRNPDPNRVTGFERPG